MNEELSSPKSYAIGFQGKGNDFFGVIIVNWLLTIITLGFYYPWAKAKRLQYLYGETSLEGDTFSFHGTGKEMFKGFLKAISLFVLLGILAYVIVDLSQMAILAPILFYAGLFAILPLAIHGSYRYRMSRTTWRGIRFGYRGNRSELTKNFFKWIFFTIITFGIYGPWMAINLRKYLLGNVRFGDAEFNYEGDGGDYFLMNIKGYLLTLITFGIYFFWWQKDLFNYYIDNLSLNKDNKEIKLSSSVSGGQFFKLAITNVLIIIFTLGLGYAWVVTRTMKYIFSNIEIEGNIDLDALTQTEVNYKDATGEDISDFLDLDFVM
jgi:uncharacterized membrane protein YjgN (DUF898 family)